MNPRRAGTPPKDLAGGPAGIGEYLRYAQENIRRSRMLFKKGDLRYAVFSANEGLELFVKAHMLRYKIIDRARAAGHFPYPAAVKAMIKITEANIGKDPPNKKQLEEALDQLSVLKEAFDMVEKKKLEIPMWKSSLNIDLADDEKARVDEFWKKLGEWSKKMKRIQGRQRLPRKQGRGKLAPDEPGRFFEAVLEAYKKDVGRSKDPRPLSLPGNIKMTRSGAMDVGQIFALGEIIIYIGVIVHSAAHQQISRYPTPIDGVDSRKIYIERKADVKKLLKRIYLVARILLKQLKYGAPLIMKSMVATSTDMKRFMRA